ncbi:cysteine proteinase [Rickenella mellea]|uniref:Cysteine proteinase n=1 Tax=Rickenella mellea TaxID=50990 RepID=A0A4Y7QJW4_9AGAM|nr:cysteine proteinase [Rickenella mellea]
MFSKRSKIPQTRQTPPKGTVENGLKRARYPFLIILLLASVHLHFPEARKAAAHAAQIPPEDKEADAKLEREAREEEKEIQSICSDLGLVMHEINPDGHCLFAAVADQLYLLGRISAQDAHYATTRAVASHYIYTHPNDFLPFLPSTEGEDGVGSADAGLMSPSQFEKYCVTIRDTGAWGGEPEILALSKAYNVPIHVVQGGKPPIVVHDPSGGPGDVNAKGAARISYHRRMYGLGEHYNSLRPKLAMSDTIKAFLS